ncbi:MAG: PQQ-binding-like beta-propeller repeat protein [Methanomicrobiaceae archaeon]|nr:PQQ-binding-like beta-propeller repeat protein [Methanomicrobiaceae archaeon]
MVILSVCLLLAGLPVGALAGTPHWTHSAPSDITDLSLTPDGSYVLTGGDRLCFLAGNGTPLWQEWTAGLTACSADGRLIAGVSGPSLTLFTRDAAVIWRQDPPSAPVALALSPDGKQVVVADRIGEVHFYDADGSLRATADTRGDPEDGIEARSDIHAIALSGKGEYVAVISSRGLFYYTGTGRKLWALEGGVEGGTAVVVSGAGSEIAAVSNADIRLLNRAGDLLWTHRYPRPVTALAIAQDGSRVLAGSQDNTLTCFDRAGEPLWTFTTGGWIRDIALSKDGSRVLAGSMDRQAYLLDGAGNLLDTYTLSGWVNHVALTADGTAGVAASPHEVIGISTATTVPPPPALETMTPAAPAPGTATSTPPALETMTPATPTPGAATPAAPTPLPEEGPGLPLFLVGLLGCSVAVGAGYLHMQRRQAPPLLEEEEEEAPAEVSPEVVEAPPAPWQASLEQGQTREAARILSREMTALIKGRTGARILCAADALDACPGQRQDLAGFFEDANRLAYASAHPTREEIEALAAVYLRLAEDIQ